MKLIKQILCVIVVAVGLSVSAMAQKGDQRKPPPKEGKPPVISPGQKPPRDNPPREGKPKKPGMAFAIWSRDLSDLA